MKHGGFSYENLGFTGKASCLIGKLSINVPFCIVLLVH